MRFPDLLALPLTAAALPLIGGKLAADSLSIFADPALRYPKIPDAMQSLCRSLAAHSREDEVSQQYRIRELRRKFGGDLAAYCGELCSPDRCGHRTNALLGVDFVRPIGFDRGGHRW
jgi:hypothetical protein